MTNSVFRKTSLDALPAKRAKELENFAVKAMSTIGMSEGSSLADIDDYDWSQLAEDRKGLLDPVLKTAGCLDYLALSVMDGADIVYQWDKLSSGRFELLVDELNNYGLHGLHFRMGVTDPLIRQQLTMKLADEIVRNHPKNSYLASSIDHQPHYPINFLSAVSSTFVENVLNGYFAWCEGNGARIEKNPYTREQALALRNAGDTHCAYDLSEQQEAIAHLLSEKQSVIMASVDEGHQAIQIEKAMLTLVYNRGYRLHAEGHSCEQIAAKLAPVVKYLLGSVEISQELSQALERQVFVNLFSAFPEGLKMLQASPEELQGVPANPMIMTDPMSLYFKHTFSGPLELFRAGLNTPYINRGTQLINFLTEAGYPIHPDLAYGGFLSDLKLHDDLVVNCHTHSKVIEEIVLPGYVAKAQDTGLKISFAPEAIPAPWIVHLMKPEILKLYGDKAALIIIRLALPHVAGFVIQPIHQIFRERPHLVEPTLTIMEEDFYLDDKAFAFCGFGVEQLRMLGSRAPEEMITSRLEKDLGL